MKAVSFFIYICLSLFGKLLFHIPFFVKNKIAHGMALIWFYLVPFRKKIILHNLIIVFPKKNDESPRDYRKRIIRLAKQNMHHMALVLLEIWERPGWTPQKLSDRVIVHNREVLEPLLEKKCGFFFLSAHLGNWELITLSGVLMGLRLAIISKYMRNRFLDDLWVKSRQDFGLQILAESGSGLNVVRSIREGKAVGFILDQHTGRPHGLLSNFLGLPAWCPKGLAILATRLKVPIVPAYFIRDAKGIHHLHFEEPLKFDKLDDFRTESGGLSEEGLLYHIRVCNENMERWIRLFPHQYLWMHRRFKNILDYKKPIIWPS